MANIYIEAKQYATKLADSLTKKDLMQFFKEVHEQFYHTVEIGFMKYFLEINNHEGEFVVHHAKLREYGVVITTDTSRIKDKLDALDLLEGEDYLFEDILENSTGRPSKHYHLTPDAFKKCLMRARRYKGQTVDPVIYSDYYILLEKIFGLYRTYESRYQEKLLSMKDDKIDRLEVKIDNQSSQIAELLLYGKQTTKTLFEVQDDLTETKEEVSIAKSYLEEKSFTSTKNPSDVSKHHHFAATVFKNKDKQYVKLISGQLSYINKTIAKHADDGRELLLEPFYNANGIDLRHNSYTEFKIYRKQVVQDENIKRVQDDREFNDQLKKEILQYNKTRGDKPKRYFGEEKRYTPLLMVKHIPIKFGKASIEYTENKYISFEDVMKLVMKVNGITQTSPLMSKM